MNFEEVVAFSSDSKKGAWRRHRQRAPWATATGGPCASRSPSRCGAPSSRTGTRGQKPHLSVELVETGAAPRTPVEAVRASLAEWKAQAWRAQQLARRAYNFPFRYRGSHVFKRSSWQCACVSIRSTDGHRCCRRRRGLLMFFKDQSLIRSRVRP